MTGTRLSTKIAAIFLIIDVVTTVSSAQTFWKRTYGQSLYSSTLFSTITSTVDGNFLIAESKSSNSKDYLYILKIKPNGDTLWTKTYFGLDIEIANVIAPCLDGTFLIVGETSSIVNGVVVNYFLKIKPNGDTLWTKIFANPDFHMNAIKQTADGNFIIVGSTYLDQSGRNLNLYKITPDGNTLWTKTYGDSGKVLNPILQTPDGNFILTGTTPSNSGFNTIYLLKINANGDSLWRKTFGDSGSDFLTNTIIPTSDGNFLIAGSTTPRDYIDNKVFLLKINQKGDSIWSKTYSRSPLSTAESITSTSDGNYIVTGSDGCFPCQSGSREIFILKIKPNGDTLWTGTYNGAGSATPYQSILTSDGNFILLGRTSSYTGTQYDYLLKISKNGDYLWSYMDSLTNTGFDGISFLSPTSDGNFIGLGSKLVCIIDDRYAYKNSLFNFKIPTYNDSLNFGYAPLKIPSGMTVSPGGTVSWTPQTDSSYMTHVEYVVADDKGQKGTLTFNIFVNSKEIPNKLINPTSFSKNSNNPLSIGISSATAFVSFSTPPNTNILGIYDIRGSLVAKLSTTNNSVLWHGTNSSGSPVSAGRYFVKALDGNVKEAKPFVFVR